MSGQEPQRYGPLSETIQPVATAIHSSYLRPAPLNLWDHLAGSNGFQSRVLKSVPSTDTLTGLPLSPTSLLSHLIYSSNKVQSVRA